MKNYEENFTAEEYRIAARVVRGRYDYGEHIARDFDARAEDIERAVQTAMFNQIVKEETPHE